MNAAARQGASERPPLRLWPGIAIVAVQWLVRFGLPVLGARYMPAALMGGLAGGALVVLWWLFFSRAPWVERLGAVGLMAIGLAATPLVLHQSVATAMMGVLYPVYAVPVVSLALVLWALASRHLAPVPRRAAMAATILAAAGGWALVRTAGVTGDFDWDFSWRWSATDEERLLARSPAATAAAATVAAAGAAVPDWPGFRGPRRDGVVTGVAVATDWGAAPPVELWRRPVGPGWSSLAIGGGLAVTQEQRGDDELVAAYELASGRPVWTHRDPVRFWEAMGGAGPRATPALGHGRVYALGATGILNALDAADGAPVWSRDAAADAGVELPGWGFAGSPLVVDDALVVAVSGRLAGYDAASGELRWLGPESAGVSYGSPQLMTLGGGEQLVLLTGKGAVSVDPADGAPLWEHAWPGFHSLQPALAANGDLLLANADSVGGLGTRRIAAARGPSGWSVEERWTSPGLKPYFNDFVVHRGHAYGFDGRILAAIDLESGERAWKGGRYGHGQLLLLADQDLLIVLSERGELALVEALPERFSELARRPAIEGKTWNHPALAGDVLVVRNGREMAAFRLAPAAG